MLSCISRFTTYKLLHLVVLGVLCILPGVAWAQSTGSSGQNEQEILQKMLEATIMLMQVLYSLLLPAISLIGSLLSNDWVMGSSTGLDYTLEHVWIFVRNLVNMVFVIVLLIMAFMYIIKAQSGDGGDYGLKSILPNIIIAVVAVNFSLLGCRVILDASSIMTSAVFSIPNTVTSWDYPFRDVERYVFVQYDKNDNVVGCMHHHYYFNIDQSFKGKLGTGQNTTTSATGTSTATTAKPTKDALLLPMVKVKDGESVDKSKVFTVDVKEGNKTITYKEAPPIATLHKQAATAEEKNKVLQDNCILDLDTLAFNERNAMYAFAYGLLNIPAYEAVLAKDIKIDRFLLSTIVGVLILFVIVAVIYSLVIALFIRTVVLWAMIAASPLWVLELVFKGGGPFKSITEKIGIGKFAELAFMPVAVGGVLSLSFIVLRAVKTSLPDLGIGQYQISVGGMSILFGDNPITAGFSSIQDFIFTLIVLAVLWTAVFAAIKMGDITGIVAKSISSVENLGKEAASLAGSGLSSLPIIPTPGGFASARAIGDGLKNIKTNIDTELDKKATAATNKLFGDVPFYTKSLEGDDRERISKASRITNPTLKNVVEFTAEVSDPNNKEVKETIRTMIDRNKELKTYASTAGAGKTFYDRLQGNGRITQEDLRKFVDNAPAGSLGTGVTKDELLEIARTMKLKTDADTSSAAPLSSFVTTQNNKVIVDGRELTGVAVADWDAIKAKLQNIQRPDGALLTSKFINGLVQNGKLRGAKEAAEQLKAVKAALPQGKELQDLAEALFGAGVDANTFVATYTGTTPS